MELTAVDIPALSARLGAPGLSLARMRGIRPADLPTKELVTPIPGSPRQAVLSWRWDIDEHDGTSLNIAAAILHAVENGIEHLFMDKISIDQSLQHSDLIRAVAGFSQLFCTIPTLAAYDTLPALSYERHFLRTMRRPWIAKEVLQMRLNPCGITYLGHLADQGASGEFGFAHMAKRIWSTSFANSLLYVLIGHCDMHDTSEIPLLLVEDSKLLSATARSMGRADALLAAAIVAQTKSGDDRVNGDIDIREQGFQSFRFEPTESSPGYWNNWHVVLGDAVVATWSEKDFTRDGDRRRKLAPAANAGPLIGAFVGLDESELVAPGVVVPPLQRGSGDGTAVRTRDLSKRFMDVQHAQAH